MSRVRGRKKRPSLPPITPSVSPDDEFLGFEEPGAGPAEMTREAIDTTTSGDSTALRVFCVEAKAVAGLDLTDCTRLKALHEHEGRWVDLVRVKGSAAPLIRKTVQLGKCTSSSIPQDAGYWKTVKNELELLQKFNSPLIVHHFGSILTDSNEAQIFMEEMDAGSLDKVLPRVGRMPELLIARICTKVAQGLDYLWTEHRAIHRDIKPGNILMNTEGDIKLCDFGTSRILEGPSANGVTFIGTMNYMSPERLEGNVHAVAGDVFSLGLTLMELATGYPRIPMDQEKYPHPPLAIMREKGVPGFQIRPKFELKRIAPFDVMKEISSQEIPFPAVDEGGFSRGMVDLAVRMLEKKPEDRVSLDSITRTAWCQLGASKEWCSAYVRWALSDPV
eukprot:m.98005 g.98005  ORF g.98005 m.98005 type:complete len:390 (-) comp12412_c0_seq3:1785-2954(-)